MDQAVQPGDREAFIEALRAADFSTYFVATHPKYAKGMEAFRFTSSPVSPAFPHHWRYEEARRWLFELSNHLTTEEAERRNVNFVNPGLKTFMPSATLPTLRGGIQLLLGGERASTHRHSANAFRFVIEAPDEGAYTVVEGVKVPMRPGDLVLTPAWAWHDHHCESDQHAIWYDGLDALMAFWMGAGFFQSHETVAGDAYAPVRQEVGATTSAFGTGLATPGRTLPIPIPASANPLLYYPYAKVRRKLAASAAAGNGDDSNGVVLDYVNPRTGGPCFPSMGLALRQIPPKSALRPMHRAENVVFIAKEGAPTFTLADRTFEAQPHDVVAIPSWVPYAIANTHDEPAVLFSQSDRPLFQALDFYREETA